MPIGMNSGELPGVGDRAGRAIATDDVASMAQADTAPAALFQVNTRLAFTPCRRATSATEAPGRTASSTIRRFSAGDHERRGALVRPPLVLGVVLSKDALKFRLPSAAGEVSITD
jgi:hypothetical protein